MNQLELEYLLTENTKSLLVMQFRRINDRSPDNRKFNPKGSTRRFHLERQVQITGQLLAN